MATRIVEVKALECTCERCPHIWNSFMTKDGAMVEPKQCPACHSVRWGTKARVPKAKKVALVEQPPAEVVVVASNEIVEVKPKEVVEPEVVKDEASE